MAGSFSWALVEIQGGGWVPHLSASERTFFAEAVAFDPKMAPGQATA